MGLTGTSGVGSVVVVNFWFVIFADFRFAATVPDYQFARCFVYFDCVFSMISSNVGDSEKPGRRSLLAQLLQRFIAAKHAGLVSRSLPPS